MENEQTLDRFIEAQHKNYNDALDEIKNGKKTTHWMWYVFPQLKALGASSTAKFYGIEDEKEAQSFFDHLVLGKRLVDISNELLKLKNNNAHEIFGSPDDLKLKSCMTLFGALKNADPVFQSVIDKFYDGEKDEKTLQLLR